MIMLLHLVCCTIAIKVLFYRIETSLAYRYKQLADILTLLVFITVASEKKKFTHAIKKIATGLGKTRHSNSLD